MASTAEDRADLHKNFHEVLMILSKSAMLDLNREQFCGSLGLDGAFLGEVVRLNIIDRSGNYGYFSKCLEKWKEANPNANLNTLANILDGQELQDLAIRIRRLGTSQNVVPTTSEPVVAASKSPASPINAKELKALQQKFIATKIADLCKCTQNWIDLKIELNQHGLLNANSTAQLDAHTNDNSRFYAMYMMVIKKKDFWEKLKDSLRNAENDEALEILDEFSI